MILVRLILKNNLHCQLQLIGKINPPRKSKFLLYSWDEKQISGRSSYYIKTLQSYSTLIQSHYHTTVLCFNVFLQIKFSCNLMITLITRILDTFMLRLNMCLKMALFCSLIITLITRIIETFMFRSVMFHHITFL